MTIPVHTLGDYLDLLSEQNLLAAPIPDGLDRNQRVTGLTCDSRQVAPGTLFIRKGAHFQTKFLEMARDQGAMACVSQEENTVPGLPRIAITDTRKVLAPLADRFYDHPSGKLKVIGITGTKGKSSTAYYMKSILDRYQESQGRGETGVVSSIDTYDGVERFESHLTTPEPLDLQRHFANAAQTGLEYVTMEVSSQALKYHRSLCTEFAAACFLNIGYDHISPIEHPDFEDYFASKLKIFAQAHISCVNLDCDHAQRVMEAAQAAGAPIITFSQKDPAAQVYASDVHKEDGQILFTLRTPRYTRQMRLTMPGLFNVENALGAAALCEALDIPEWAVYDGLVRARVPGRMEVYANDDGRVLSIVDYAHNRLSFETLFSSVRAEYPERELAIVFGCRARRPTTAATTWARPPAPGVTGSTSPRRTAGRRTPWTSAMKSSPTWKRARPSAASSPTGARPSARRCWRVKSPRCCCSPARAGRPGRSGAPSISTPPPTWSMSRRFCRSMTCATVSPPPLRPRRRWRLCPLWSR